MRASRLLGLRLAASACGACACRAAAAMPRQQQHCRKDNARRRKRDVAIRELRIIDPSRSGRCQQRISGWPLRRIVNIRSFQLPAFSFQLPTLSFTSLQNFSTPSTSDFKIQNSDFLRLLVISRRSHGRSPTPGLLVGLILTLAAVVTYSLYINRQIAGLRVLQSDLVDRNRKDSLQLLRIQNNLNQLGLAMRDMLDDDHAYPLVAWSAQFAAHPRGSRRCAGAAGRSWRRRAARRRSRSAGRLADGVLGRGRSHVRAGR